MSEPQQRGPSPEEIEKAWTRPRSPQAYPRNALGNEIWFAGASTRYMPSTAKGWYIYLAVILIGSLWGGGIGLLAQFGVLSGAWVGGIGFPPMVIGGLLFWRFAHQHSPYAGRSRNRSA